MQLVQYIRGRGNIQVIGYGYVRSGSWYDMVMLDLDHDMVMLDLDHGMAWLCQIWIMV